MSTEKKLVPSGTLDKLNAVAAASATKIVDNTRPIDVNMGKLIEGVSLIFAGVLRLLSALDAEDGNVPHAGEESPSDAAGAPKAERTTRGALISGLKPADGVVNDHTGDHGSSALDGIVPDSNGDPAFSVPSVERVQSENNAPLEPVQPSVTADDLTKVIVRKIKQNRSNTQKIGSILKTFGVSRVSDLPAGQYEAFLTELSQL